METAVSITPDARMTNEQAYDRALQVLLSVAGLARTKAVLEDVMNFAADKARCRDENPQALSER
ncbi:hypothetical protein, partial [Burkholderia ubonensis]|uniref:hypothetical protein n=1 Tax=Burkholderia ubonensis TaxID=101571 RepID=UPI000A8AB604